jgi:hypothetical protein
MHTFAVPMNDGKNVALLSVCYLRYMVVSSCFMRELLGGRCHPVVTKSGVLESVSCSSGHASCDHIELVMMNLVEFCCL